MTTATETFFTSLGDRGYEPLLQRANGTVRIDLGEMPWYLEVHKGKVDVSRRDDDAQCVVRAEPQVFDKVASGQTNAMTALLRNEMMFDGDPSLIVLLQKLFPWPAKGTKS